MAKPQSLRTLNEFTSKLKMAIVQSTASRTMIRHGWKPADQMHCSEDIAYAHLQAEILTDRLYVTPRKCIVKAADHSVQFTPLFFIFCFVGFALAGSGSRICRTKICIPWQYR